MIKIYSMNTCPDCIYVEEQIQGDDRYEIIDIGSHVKYLKEFLRIRDNSPVFNEAKKVGAAGIPCFVLEDGSVTLIPVSYTHLDVYKRQVHMMHDGQRGHIVLFL